MINPKLILLPFLCLAMTACAMNEPKSAQYDPPTVSLTVADDAHLDDADKDARKFCRKYDKKAERRDVTPVPEGVAVSYQCL